MSSSELLEHAGYFRDVHKLRAYERALADVVRPGDVVVDLGAGTGLLGLMAARAGAARVYMVDRGPILGLASEIAARNGLADRVIAVRSDSADLTLPELADVIVCDQIGGFVYDAGVLEFFDDARRRLLKPGGTMIPGSFTLHMAPVSAPAVRENIDVWSTRPAGFDTEPLRQSAINNEWRWMSPRLSSVPVRQRSRPSTPGPWLASTRRSTSRSKPRVGSTDCSGGFMLSCRPVCS